MLFEERWRTNLVRSKKEILLLQALEAAALSQGFDLVDIERAGQGKNPVLRVYLNREGGLTLDVLAAANIWVSEVVEALDPFAGSYTLEVSSPGIDRPLRTLAHFEAAIGEEVVITLEKQKESDPKAQPRLTYTGIVAGVEREKQLIQLQVEGTLHELDATQIKKARVRSR